MDIFVYSSEQCPVTSLQSRRYFSRRFSILALASAVFPRTADPVRSAVEVPISLRVRCREACLTILLTTYSAVVSRGGVIRARIARCRYLKYGGMPQSVNADAVHDVDGG